MLSSLLFFIVSVAFWPMWFVAVMQHPNFQRAMNNSNDWYYDFSGVEMLWGLFCGLLLLLIAMLVRIFLGLGVAWYFYVGAYLIFGVIFYFATKRKNFKKMLTPGSPYRAQKVEVAPPEIPPQVEVLPPEAPSQEVRVLPKDSPFAALPEDSDRLGDTTYYYPHASGIIKLREETMDKIEDAAKRKECDDLFSGLIFLLGAAQVKFSKARGALSRNEEKEFRVQREWAVDDLEVAAIRAGRITDAYLRT